MSNFLGDGECASHWRGNDFLGCSVVVFLISDEELWWSSTILEPNDFSRNSLIEDDDRKVKLEFFFSCWPCMFECAVIENLKHLDLGQVNRRLCDLIVSLRYCITKAAIYCFVKTKLSVQSRVTCCSWQL